MDPSLPPSSSSGPPREGPNFITLTTEQFERLLTLRNPTDPSPRPPRSEKLPDVLEYSGEPDTLARFETELQTRFFVNADRYPTAESRIAYAYGRLRGRAADLCLHGLRTTGYGDYEDVVSVCRSAFEHSDPMFLHATRALDMKQRSRPFADFFAEFRSELLLSGAFTDPVTAKQVLRHALLVELTQALSTTDLRPLSYDEFVDECMRQDALLRQHAAVRAGAASSKAPPPGQTPSRFHGRRYAQDRSFSSGSSPSPRRQGH